LVSRPYNDSIFNIRYNFKDIFPECKYGDAGHVHGHENKLVVDFQKIHKINYSVNLLPAFGEYIIKDK